jgi:hypothetical protein
MNNRIDAIYARQSVDKKDSISIESIMKKGPKTFLEAHNRLNRIGKEYDD